MFADFGWLELVLVLLVLVAVGFGLSYLARGLPYSRPPVKEEREERGEDTDDD